MIRIQSFCKKFRKLQVLNQVTAQFNKGQVVALIGPNGSGKTTLIKSILSLVKSDEGEIWFNNISIHNNESYRSDIGYMPQMGHYPENMKIEQLFRMIKNIRSDQKSWDEDLFYKFGLHEIAGKNMKSLSGGTRQKVSAALAFLFNPEVLILDEPTAGLDPLSSEILKEKIIYEKKKGKLFLITSHILSDLEEFCTHVMYLQEGKIVFYKELTELQRSTGETKLTKAIAHFMKNADKTISGN
jgi:Cu-processing system ATP-binding protein